MIKRRATEARERKAREAQSAAAAKVRVLLPIILGLRSCSHSLIEEVDFFFASVFTICIHETSQVIIAFISLSFTVPAHLALYLFLHLTSTTMRRLKVGLQGGGVLRIGGQRRASSRVGPRHAHCHVPHLPRQNSIGRNRRPRRKVLERGGSDLFFAFPFDSFFLLSLSLSLLPFLETFFSVHFISECFFRVVTN